MPTESDIRRSRPATLRRFLTDEAGSTTADWIVLCSAVVGLGLGGVTMVRTGTAALGNDINASLRQASVAQLREIGYTGAYVVSSGRGVEWYTDPVCDKNGCTQGFTTLQMYYQLDNNSGANMLTITQDDGTSVTTWTDTQGNRIPAPRFPD